MPLGSFTEFIVEIKTEIKIDDNPKIPAVLQIWSMGFLLLLHLYISSCLQQSNFIQSSWKVSWIACFPFWNQMFWKMKLNRLT